MSTRKLILAALVCGLAILLAGGVFLVTLAANRDELTVPDALALGTEADVAGVHATVVGVSEGDAAITVNVRVSVDTVALTDVGDGWALVVGTARGPVGIPGAAGQPRCAGVALADGTVECLLAFARGRVPAAGAGFVEYAHDGDRARWRV